MALVVTFDGKYKPYQSSSTAPLIKRSERISNITPVFKDLLQDYLDKEINQKTKEPKPELKSSIILYEKMEKHVRARVYARDIMYRYPKTLSSSVTINEAAKLMQQNQFHHVPIVDQDKLVGIVSDRNILEAMAGDIKLSNQIYSIMSKKVISGQEHTSISEIARVFLEEGIHSLPIIDSKTKLKGIVTTTDILHFLVTSFPLELYG